jgi:hypothetical protein
VDSGNINLKIGLFVCLFVLTRPGRDAQGVIFECNQSKTVSHVFHDLKNVKIAENSLKIGQLLPILANFSQF